MSGAGVQRAIVRMMFDPAFRDAVYADAAAALAGCEVSEEERGWLVRPDRRAYATDATRQARALLAIEAELPAAIAWARGEGRVMAEFFGSNELHACVEDRGVLTLAFATWLARGAGAELATLVALEAAVARARRGADVRKADAGHVVRSARVVLVETREGALEWWSAVQSAAANGDPLPRVTLGEPCTVLVEVRADGEASVELLADGLAAVLRTTSAPIARTSLEARAVELGLDEPEARELIDDLLAGGVLVPS